MQKKSESNTKDKDQSYVYIYRELSGKIFYVGRGSSATRPPSHETKTHNKELEKRLADKEKKWHVEITGPFPAITADIVETALVSALKGADPKLFNVHLCSTKWRFRPLGVPSHLVDRLDMKCISKKELKKIVVEGAILVHVNPDMEIPDREFTMANLPDDKALLERIDRWWKMRKLAAGWAENPDLSPRWLLGISGPPRNQVVIGCAEIDCSGWETAETSTESKTIVPTMKTKSGVVCIDKHEFRGRKLDPDLDIKFTLLSYISPDKLREMLGI